FKQGWKNAVKEEVSIYASDSKAIPVLMSVNTFPLDDIIVLSIILTDLTIQKKNQEELKLKKRQLEQKNIELENAYKELVGQTEENAKQGVELVIANKELVQKNQEIALSKYNKRFLTEFSEKFSGYKLHNEFFSSLVQFIADTTHLDYVFVGKKESIGSNDHAIQTIAFTAFGKLADNINYLLPDGPCEQVIQGNLCSYPEQCRSIFPNNKTIAQFNIEGYIGYRLYDEQGNAVGLIAVMHKKKIEDPETVSSILKIVAKRAEIELERIKNEELLVQHNEILQEKNEELSKMNTELESFTYVASHDLQEPLRKIQTFAGLLQERKKEQLSEDVKADLIKITTAANRMRVLIDDLLNYSCIVKDKHSYVETDLNKVVDNVLIDFDLLIAQKKAIIKVEKLPTIEAIPLQMSQLFCNTIANALKFSKRDIPPVINITTNGLSKVQLDQYPNLKKEIEYFEFIIKDNGIGFNQKYADQIFTIFQRLNGYNEYAGTGIGLAMCRKIALNHGGEIYAEGKENEGAVFHIILPARQG
ncbi:MAG: ATP-binding protein, partial [Chitinophagaceae bacterium]